MSKLPFRVRSPYRVEERLFPLLGFAVIFSSGLMFCVLLTDIVRDGLPRLDWQFLTSFPSRKPQKAGILAAIVGTLWVMGLIGLIAIPLGICAATYLEEYAPRNKWMNAIELNIANLAGVPSIIYGLLGLALFVRTLHLGRSLIAGAMTLSLLVIPIIILSSREALRAVPQSIREASYALGASRWETIRDQVWPAALPGILTGIILALSRAIGETAPLVAIGALTYVNFLPGSDLFSAQFPWFNLKCLLDPFSALPIQIFNWLSRPQKAFLTNAAAAILVLLALTFIMNSMAIVLRNRARKSMR